MSQRLPGISEEVLERAKLTPAQLDALALYAGGAGYWRVAMALGISRESARDRIRAGTAKLAQAMRPEAETPAKDVRDPPTPERPTRTVEAGVQVFVE